MVSGVVLTPRRASRGSDVMPRRRKVVCAGARGHVCTRLPSFCFLLRYLAVKHACVCAGLQRGYMAAPGGGGEGGTLRQGQSTSSNFTSEKGGDRKRSRGETSSDYAGVNRQRKWARKVEAECRTGESWARGRGAFTNGEAGNTGKGGTGHGGTETPAARQAPTAAALTPPLHRRGRVHSRNRV